MRAKSRKNCFHALERATVQLWEERCPQAFTASSYDLCIVGAGYAGVNISAAKDYLSPGARVLVVDQRDGCTGQWRDQYPYVRLHQPYRHFTAGDVPWALDKPRDYLAARDEVVAHIKQLPLRHRRSRRQNPLPAPLRLPP